MVILSILESIFISKVLWYRNIIFSYSKSFYLAILIYVLNYSYILIGSSKTTDLFFSTMIEYNNGILFLVPIVIIISSVDIIYRIVFDIDIICGIIIEVVFLLLTGDKTLCIGSFLGGALLFVISFSICKISKQMGMGDVFYYALCGLAVGLNYSIVMFFLSFFIAFLYILIIKLTGKDFTSGLISFTPFISISLLIVTIL